MLAPSERGLRCRAAVSMGSWGAALVLVAAVLIAAAGGPVAAESRLQEAREAREEAERERADLRRQLGAVEQDAAAAQAEVADALAREAELRAQRDEAEERLAELQEQFLKAAAAFEEARYELGEIDAELARLERSVARLLEAVAEREAQVGHLVRGLYKGGGQVAAIDAVLRSQVIGETIKRVGYIQSAQHHQQDIIQGLVADRRALEREQADTEVARQRQAEVAAELEERRIDLEEQVERQETEVVELRGIVADAEAELAALEATLASLSSDVATLRADERAASQLVAELRDAEKAEEERLAEERRVAAAARGSRSGGGGPSNVACPLGQPRWFMDTWGAARSGGRAHRGTDMFAPRGTPIYAFESGTVRRSSNALGGIVLYLDGDSGYRYYYAHLDGYVDGLSGGQRVTVGEHIAYNGNTGNAITTPPHLHIEVRPPGSAQVNPYPYMRGACG